MHDITSTRNHKLHPVTAECSRWASRNKLIMITWLQHNFNTTKKLILAKAYSFVHFMDFRNYLLLNVAACSVYRFYSCFFRISELEIFSLYWNLVFFRVILLLISIIIRNMLFFFCSFKNSQMHELRGILKQWHSDNTTFTS